MKYVLITGSVILGCSILILAGCAYWIGLETERMAQAPQPGLEFNHIERGWFTSEADSRLFINPSSSSVSGQGVALRHKIYHGPLPLDGWPVPALLTVRTTLAADSLQPFQWIEPATDQALLSVDSRVAFDQSLHHHIHIAPVRLSRPLADIDSLTLSGDLDGRLEVSASGQLMTAALDLAGLEFIQKSHTTAFELKQLNLLLTQENDNYRLELDATLDRLKLKQEISGPGNLRLSIESLDHQALMQSGQSIFSSADQILLLQTLLQQRPRIVLHELNLQTPRGPLQASADLTLREFSLLKLLSPLGLIGAVLSRAEAKIAIARPLLEWFIPESQLSRWREAGFVELENQLYHSHIQLHDEQLKINDNYLALP